MYLRVVGHAASRKNTVWCTASLKKLLISFRRGITIERRHHLAMVGQTLRLRAPLGCAVLIRVRCSDIVKFSKSQATRPAQGTALPHELLRLHARCPTPIPSAISIRLGTS